MGCVWSVGRGLGHKQQQKNINKGTFHLRSEGVMIAYEHLSHWRWAKFIGQIPNQYSNGNLIWKQKDKARFHV